jgi:alanine racemase
VTIVLQVRQDRWRDHLASVTSAAPGLVPVAKGNGYGFGVDVLAAEAAALGMDTLAVGTYTEVPGAASFGGTLAVLSPWRPFLGAPLHSPRLVHTLSRLQDLPALAQQAADAGAPPPRVLVEVETSMHRHGIPAGRLGEVEPLLHGLSLVGWTMHLPIAADNTGQARALGAAARQVRDAPLWVSHVPVERLAEVGPQVRLRMGTALWLGAADALAVRARVLDVHRLERGDRYGYRQRPSRRDATLLVVAGGTAHGVGLAAPTPATRLRQRGIALAEGGLAASGLARSPFVVGGRYAWFAEPPHMQCSMLWAPPGGPVPEVGDWLEVRLRHTTAHVDALVWA